MKLMKQQRGSALADLLALVAIVGLLVIGLMGWAKNLVAIVESNDIFTGLFVLRVVGVVLAPLGAVLGWM